MITTHPALENLQQIDNTLGTDVEKAQKLYVSSPSDFSKRVLVKTIFTYLEGHIYAFKQTVLAMEEILKHPMSGLIPRSVKSWVALFSDQEKAMLQEFTYEMGSGGKACKRNYSPRFEDNIKFLIKTFHAAIELESKIDFQSEGWDRMKKTRGIRNRLTHPKTPADLNISDEDIKTAGLAIGWYQATVSSMLDRLEKDSFFAPRFKQPN
ncbi:MAG TPA: hypothetical protein VFC17_05270 [Candidatus Limnocylindrales bacterium]|nr:hypothetical protein [Candidatus Limnocylindrales bacterium]